MGWGIGLGRDWLSGRYALLCLFLLFRFMLSFSSEKKRKRREPNRRTIPLQKPRDTPTTREAHTSTNATNQPTVSAPPALALKPPSTASNSSAKTSGPYSSASKSTT